MNNKLLLAKGITLLFRESQIVGATENSAALVREILALIKRPEVSVGVDHEGDILDGLIGTALEMCDSPVDHCHEAVEVLQRVKINTGEDVELYDAIRSGIESELAESTIKRNCLNIRRTLTMHLREVKIGEVMNNAARKIKFKRDTVTDFRKFVTEVIAQLEPYTVDVTTKDPAVISDVNMHNLNDVSKVFSDVQKSAEGSTVLRTGHQGLNRMLDGGFRRGEEWVFGALQHNYKTGMSLSVFMDVALYNKPVLTDPNKKPMLLRISFEDPLVLNFQFLYQRLKAMETGGLVDITGLDPEVMAAYVQEKLGVNGWHTHFMHVNPSMWTYRDICNKIIELETEGYEIHLCSVDYLLKVPTTGCDQGPHGVDIRNMYERIANFIKQRNICFITPHQLSTDAKMLIRDGRTDFVRQLIGRGYYAGCKQLDQVVDGELFMHIEKVNGKSYLTIQRGKHRKINQTPEEFLYLVLEFDEVGLKSDVMGPDTSRKKVGGGPIGSGEETPFWGFKDQ